MRKPDARCTRPVGHSRPSVSSPGVPAQPDRRHAIGQLTRLGVLGLAAPWSGLMVPAALASTHDAPSNGPVIRRGTVLRFPRDHGAHEAFRTEWWYATGWLTVADQAPQVPPLGFQITFFRSRVDEAQGHPSAFAARQLLFAHAAVTDTPTQRLLHRQAIARAGFGLAQASTEDTDVFIRDWRLQRHADGHYLATLPPGGSGDARFGYALQLTPTQPLLLQGDAGYSQKGPDPVQASHYYSQPHLAVQGQLTLGTRRLPVTGTAWLDHEWSEALMHPQAVGWDWIGMNLFDGSALTAFRLRTREGGAIWAGGSFRRPGGPVQAFEPDAVRFEPLRHWTSPATDARYPVQWAVHTPAGRFEVHALMDAQELDSRGNTGAIYWEGLSDLRDDAGRLVGRGYLEMTGYAGALRL